MEDIRFSGGEKRLSTFNAASLQLQLQVDK
jgi:hypothetical protein